MGKKGGSAKQEITRYHMSQHFGICAGPVDAMVAIYAQEKLLWSGEETTASVFPVDKSQLFGGRLKEGGVEAVIYWLPGASDQVLPDLLAQKLGRANGADAPGYRGIASAFFVGPRGTPYSDPDLWDKTTEGRAGAYWRANNPYLPTVWIKVRRAPVGLDPEFALVPLVAGVLTGEVELTWWQNRQGNNDAPGRMGISFRDQGGNQIGSTIWSAWDDPAGWTERTLNAGDCPAGTTTIRLHMHADRISGNYADAFFDDIECTLDGVPLPIVNPGAETGDMTGWTGLPFYAGPDPDRSVPTALTGSYYFAGGRASAPQVHQDVTTNQPGADANPAHIIYECLTNTDWGMGSPETAIDKANFESVAVTLYGEAFGLSLLWTRQASIQDFIQEILDHIQAVLFVDPATGLMTLKLIRGDYDVETLATINPDNANLTNFSRKLWGEIANEINVTWTNPENEQEETVTAQDLASIATQGGIVSDSRNYYGVRNALLAMKLAQRDLRSAGAPLATCEAEVDRTQWELRPASVIKLTWPEYGLEEVVFRVTSIDYGRVGDPTIKLQLIEDVFGLDFGEYTEPPSTGWEDPAEDPEALTIERVFTLPLFFAADSTVAAFVNDPEYPEVVAGLLGTTDQEDAFGYDLWDEVTLANGDLEWQEIATRNIIGHAELTNALVAEAVSTGVLFDTLLGDFAPSVAGFLIIGDGEESENEIAMVDAVGADYDLVRGVLDTVPQAWPAGTPVWFIDGETAMEYPDVRSAGETLDVKMLTNTSRGTLDLDDAALVSATLTDRPWLPNRPANVEVDGVLFNTAETPVDMTGRADPWVTISVAHRNRLTEDSQVLSWTDATVTPEDGQTATIEVYAEDGSTLLDTHDGISATSFDVPDASFGGETIVLLKALAKRTDDDGEFVSLQGHGIWVQVGHARVTEDSELRVTEDGEPRALEG